MNDGSDVALFTELCAVLTDMPGLQYVAMGVNAAMMECQDYTGPGAWLCRLPGVLQSALMRAGMCVQRPRVPAVCGLLCWGCGCRGCQRGASQLETVGACSWISLNNQG